MRSMGARAGVVAVVLAVSATAAGCGQERETFQDALAEVVAQMSLETRSYVYEDVVRGGSTTTVAVQIEDDFRYHAVWSEDGTEVYEEVVSDDAIAVQTRDLDLVLDRIGAKVDIDPTAVDDALADALVGAEQEPDGVADGATDGATEADAETTDPAAGDGADGSSALRGSQALGAGQWVVDQIGAPPLSVRTTLEDLGVDPVVDAVGVLGLVEATVRETPNVGKWDDSAIEYRPDKDPFRAPEVDADGNEVEVRYDLLAEPFLNRAAVTDAQQSSAATEAMLRQMAVYTRDGIVTEIVVKIDTSAIFEEIERAYGLPDDGTDEERADRAIVKVNEVRSELGQDPIIARDIRVVFDRVGDDERVTLPSDATVASLSFLVNRGSLTGELPVEPPPSSSDEPPAPEVAEPADTETTTPPAPSPTP